jgi:purine-binding chemotaxis protein CheW
MVEQKEAENALEKWEEIGQRGIVKGEDSFKALTFWLANEEYAIDISVIEEITRPIVVTTVPRVPPYIKGIVNLRGRVIPVLNVHVRMGLAAFAPGNKNRFIICRTEQSEVGIIADKVTDVVCFEKYQLEPPPAKIAASGTGFIKNIGRVKDRILIILDTEKILKIVEGATSS